MSLTSCNKVWDIVQCNSYIRSYYELNDENSFCVQKHTEDSIVFSTGVMGKQIPFCSAQSLRKEGSGSLVEASPKNFKDYDELRNKYNDVLYSKENKIGSYTICTDPGAVSEEITEVLIFSDSDWDEFHPAGSSLNDIFSIQYASHYPYIQSGYDDSALIRHDGELTYKTKPLAELCEEDLVLLDHESSLIFKTSLPSQKEVANIYLHLKSKSGTNYSYTAAYK